MTIGVMYIGLLLLLIGGIVAGSSGTTSAAAGSGRARDPRRHHRRDVRDGDTLLYEQLRAAAGARAKVPKVDPNPLVNQAEIDALAGSSRPAVLLAIGKVGFLLILWLMVLKPF